MKLVLLRKGQRIEKEITPKLDEASGRGRLGVRLSAKEEGIVIVHPKPLDQVVESLLMMVDTLNALVHTKTTGVGVKDLSGPVGIGTILYQSIQVDFRLALAFLVMLNVNLAVVNLLPIPVLDGGHIVFSILESIRRKPLNQRFMEATQTVFVVLLLTFMVYITFHDVHRLKRWGFFSSSEQPAKTQPPPPASAEKPSQGGR
jgi:regulator of sigma E protease